MGGEWREVLVIVSLFQALLSFTNPEWQIYYPRLRSGTTCFTCEEYIVEFKSRKFR